jgi:hypothetical protein
MQYYSIQTYSINAVSMPKPSILALLSADDEVRKVMMTLLKHSQSSKTGGYQIFTAF